MECGQEICLGADLNSEDCLLSARNPKRSEREIFLQRSRYGRFGRFLITNPSESKTIQDMTRKGVPSDDWGAAKDRHLGLLVPFWGGQTNPQMAFHGMK